MDSNKKKIIRDNLNELINITSRLDDVINHLAEMEILNVYMVKYLRKFTELKTRIREFYEMIQGRGPYAYDYLVQALRLTDNFRAEQLLCNHRFSIYESPFKLPSKVIHSEVIQNDPEVVLRSPVIDELDVMKTIDLSNIVVKRHPGNKFMDIDEDNKPGGVYRMRSRPRGHALLINIHETVDHNDRRGSEIDFGKLRKLLKELDYKVFDHSNLTLEEMKTEVKEFSSHPNLKNVDSLIVFLMCHGVRPNLPDVRSIELITSDGRHVSSDWIIDQFMPDTSPSVTRVEDRKPKMFFFQACRVEEAARSNVRYTKSTIPWMSTRRLSVRNYEDTFLTFPTVSGYPSMRDRKEGSWFVNAFCDIVAEHAWEYDLDTMISMVHDRVRIKESEHGHQTVEFSKLGATKKLFFNPGLYEDEVTTQETERISL